MNSAAPKIPLKIETKINHYANETFTQLMHEHPIFPIRKAKEHTPLLSSLWAHASQRP